MSLKIGQKIKHPQHGVGIVKSIDGSDAVVDFETGMEKEEKGVHKPHFMAHKNTGTSDIGARMVSGQKPSKSLKEYATKEHERVLSDLKSMPKPNLPKSEEMSKDDMPHEPNSPEDKAHDIVEEGDSIQQALAILDTPEKQKQMFEHLRTLVEQSEHRSEENQEVGQESEEGMEKEEKGVHEARYGRGAGKSKAGVFAHSAKIHEDLGHEMSAEQDRVRARSLHREKLNELKDMPKPNLPKSEEGMEKSEYSAREVAIAVLKKAESMAREWQNSKPEKIMQDSVLSEKRDVVNENDIIDAASQAMTDKSPLRLKAWVEARKAKK